MTVDGYGIKKGASGLQANQEDCENEEQRPFDVELAPVFKGS